MQVRRRGIPHTASEIGENEKVPHNDVDGWARLARSGRVDGKYVLRQAHAIGRQRIDVGSDEAARDVLVPQLVVTEIILRSASKGEAQMRRWKREDCSDTRSGCIRMEVAEGGCVSETCKFAAAAGVWEGKEGGGEGGGRRMTYGQDEHDVGPPCGHGSGTAACSQGRNDSDEGQKPVHGGWC